MNLFDNFFSMVHRIHPPKAKTSSNRFVNLFSLAMVNKCDMLHKHVSKLYPIKYATFFEMLSQMLYLSVPDAELCHLFTNYIIKSGIPPIQGLKVLAQAVDKIRLFDSQLTPVHADLFQLSLCAKIFNPALKFLDVDITAISTTDVRRPEHISNYIWTIHSLLISFLCAECRTTITTQNTSFCTIIMVVWFIRRWKIMNVLYTSLRWLFQRRH